MSHKFIKFHKDMTYNSEVFTKGKIYKMTDELGYSLRWIKRGCEEVTEAEFLKVNKVADKIIPAPIAPPIAPPVENVAPQTLDEGDDLLGPIPTKVENNPVKPLATKFNLGKNRK
jgi:hypothetical protein